MRILTLIVTIVAILLTPRPAHAQNRWLTRITVGCTAAYNVLSIVDIAGTEYGVARGWVDEGNPAFKGAVTKGPKAAGFAKGLVTTAIDYVLVKQANGLGLMPDQPAGKQHQRLVSIVACSTATFQGVVDHHNFKTIGLAMQVGR